jgi:hypothetical protein
MGHRMRLPLTKFDTIALTIIDVGTSSWRPTSRNAAGPVPSVEDLRIDHERFGSSYDPSINGHLHYPNDFDRSLNEAAADKIRHTALTIIMSL